MFVDSFWALVPTIIAIVLALITKEVYSSLFIGIIVGGLLYTNFNLAATMHHIFVDGMLGQLSDSWNVGILVFLVFLGTMVMIMNRAGGSAAFGKWTIKHVKTKIGAQLATIALGCLIFIDDYFNCLTVGSVMKPVTDKHKISREKLAYLIDATAAPVCIIAPISSWAAAVTGFVDGANGLSLFIRAIPYNFYAILTLIMLLTLSITGFDYGPMKRAEENHLANDSAGNEHTVPSITGAEDQPEPPVSTKGRVIHLVVPIVALIFFSVIGMIATGGFFEGANIVDAFANSDASVGLVYGSATAFIFTVIFMRVTKVLSFTECMNAIPEGFKSMVPAVLILTLAWTLKSMTDSLGAANYISGIVETIADKDALMSILPAIVFIIGALMAFATGTSWGTFGILIPIVAHVFGSDISNELLIISISACMAGAVCGDHCSPISDTTIMASAGANCKHIRHVNTQLPYAITAAIVSCLTFLISGFIRKWFICMPIGIVLMIVTILGIKSYNENRAK
ncbi:MULTISPECIES: Na+/H+ antiporter NhaC family protein [unclassified Butyrivibrio]|uniref:Na+/H+ antiporter NhaC family protein n=1 Tax=unclassified Butyrivibrio TaxID=2639466 RepID=UPI00041DAAAF|nr:MULTISPECIES: Na+/H+ antiporter NhaC family protein [unclassified Butyrivibrio]